MTTRNIRRAIITGPTGAIGMALIDELVGQNVEVLVICRENSARNKQIPENALITKIECSLEHLSSLRPIDEKKYDVFFHFGWTGTTGFARNDMYVQNDNVRFALDAVELAHTFGCQLFIGAGSQAEYGPVLDRIKITDKTPTFPVMGYGIAKLCAGQMTKERAKQLGMEHIWTRILSVYGPFDGKQSMVMSGIEKMLRRERAAYTKGEQMWDYLYSKDAAKAFVALAHSGKDGNVYPLGAGKVRPLREYIELIREKVDPDAEIGIGEVPYNQNQVMYLCADISKLKQDTGFEPKYSFEEGIQETIDWCRGRK